MLWSYYRVNTFEVYCLKYKGMMFEIEFFNFYNFYSCLNIKFVLLMTISKLFTKQFSEKVFACFGKVTIFQVKTPCQTILKDLWQE